MKTDVGDVPAHLPRKNRHLHRWPDIWIAISLARHDISDSDRDRLQAVKDARRAVPLERWGVLVGQEGATPQQRRKVRELLPEDYRLISTGDLHATVRGVDKLIACPKEMSEPVNQSRVSTVWTAIRYARHRKVPVIIVLPNGALLPHDKRGT